MRHRTPGILFLSAISIICQSQSAQTDLPTKNSQINPNDTYVTFDEITVRQTQFASSGGQTTASANGEKQSSVTRQAKIHVQEGYDSAGNLVLDFSIPSSGPSDKTVIREARFSGGKAEFFDGNGEPVQPSAAETQLATAARMAPLLSLTRAPAIQNIQSYAKAASATIAGSTPGSATTPATVTLNMGKSGAKGGTLNKTFTWSGEGWVLSQIAITHAISNGSTSSVTAFSNVQWHQNSANDATRKAMQANRPVRQAVPLANVAHVSSGTGRIEGASGCSTTVTKLGGSQNVVFQHGIFSNSCTWSDSTYSMTAALNGALSFGTEIVPSLNSTDHLANQASALVTQLQTTGGSHYVLIGHSQGGLISRSAAQYFQTNSPSTVTGVITVDTPNQGAAIIENGIGAASKLGNYLSFIIDDIEGIFDCYDEFGDYGPFCSVGCGDPNGGELLCGLLLAGSGDDNIINDAIYVAGLYVLNSAYPATADLEPGSSFLNSLNSFSENFVRVGIVSDSTDIYGPFLPEHLAGDFFGGAAVGQDVVLGFQVADAALNGAIVALLADEDDNDCIDFPDQDVCVNDDAYIYVYSVIDNDIFVPDDYYDPLPLPNGCCDFSDGIVNGQSQYYPPQSSVPQYVILGADTHVASTKSALVASALVTALERNFFVPALGCSYALSPSGVTESQAGGNGTFTITTGSGCAWTVVSTANWITFSPSSGTGSATISYTVASNPGGGRSGDLVVAGLANFAVTQNGPPPETLTVTVNGGGTVISSPAGISCPSTCSATFMSGTVVNLTASASVGYKFTGWSGACTGTGTCTVTLTSNQSVTATFTSEPAQTVTVSVSGSGTVTSSPSGISCPGTCSASFAYGTAVTLSDSPSSRYIFAGWGGACASTGMCVVSATQASNVSAGFDEVMPGTINIIGGNGTAGYSGDGGAATSAELHGANAVAVDAAGNTYIADYYNNRIRKITASTGIISTVAGNGTAGFSGDGGAATSAEINGPGDVAVDSAGNIYFSDNSNYRVRKVTASTGIISTVVGNGTKGYSGDDGKATSAEIDGVSVKTDSAGNLYLADTFNYRVRKVTVSTGIITTVAGNGTAGFSGDGGAATSAELNLPDGVIVDSAGNIYISDHNNNRIRKVTASTGKIATIAGNGTAGYSGDGGAATSAELNGPGGLAVNAAGDLFIGDFSNNRVRKITAATGIISTLVGNGIGSYSGDGGPATDAEVFGPSGIALDSTGDIYIPDFGNNRIRAVTPSIYTIGGNGTAGYSGDGGAATSAELHGANAVAVDAAGNTYIADYYNNRIRKITASTGIISTVAGNGTAGFSGDGGAATSAEINGPGDVALDSAGNIYIADNNNYRIRKVTASTGIISTVVGNGTKGYSGDGGKATSAEIDGASVRADSAGNLYLADTFNYRIRKVTASTGIITTVAGNGTAGFSGDGGAATSAEFNLPDAVIVDSAGNLYISDYNNQRIRKVTASTGKIATIAGNGTEGYSGDGGPATSAEFNGPGGLALNAAGDLYIGDFSNNRVRMITAATGIISTVAGNGVAGYSGDGGPAINAELHGASGVVLDKAGNLYIPDFGNNRIRFVGP